MKPNPKEKQFGQKGINDSATSLAQSLLSGKPLARAPAQDRTPKLKPRPKPRFGRKAVGADGGATPVKGAGWKIGLGLLVALGVGLQMLSVLLSSASLKDPQAGAPIVSALDPQNPL